MSPTYIGTADTFTSIPALLISDLARIDDPLVRRALLQVQNYCNSIGEVHGSAGTGTAALGTNCPAVTPGAPAFWTQVSYQGHKAWIPTWV